jgi:hypothetical protein
MKTFRITLKTDETKIITGINILFALTAAGIPSTELKHWLPL